VNPNAVQYGGGPGRGIAQWSVGGRWDGSANDNVVWYAGTKGASPWSLDLQLEFIWYELTTFGYGFADLKATNNVTDATVVFQDKFEICGACNSTQRIAYAMDVLNAYGVAPSYQAKYVSQSWPLASSAMTIQCGEDVPAHIVLRNAGAKAWDVITKLGTTQPRDRSSIFAGADWLGPNRPSHATGAVSPGADFEFDFTFHGPTGAACVPGDYHEFFGVVEEGVAWFSDAGQGGPPDDQIEAWIQLVPAPPGPDMASSSSADLGGGGADMGRSVSGDMGRGAAGDGAPASDASDGSSAIEGGCSTGGRRGSPGAALLVLLLGGIRLGRRRRR
jgi:MYXO-CTERM domain-containing protein